MARVNRVASLSMRITWFCACIAVLASLSLGSASPLGDVQQVEQQQPFLGSLPAVKDATYKVVSVVLSDSKVQKYDFMEISVDFKSPLSFDDSVFRPPRVPIVSASSLRERASKQAANKTTSPPEPVQYRDGNPFVDQRDFFDRTRHPLNHMLHLQCGDKWFSPANISNYCERNAQQWRQHTHSKQKQQQQDANATTSFSAASSSVYYTKLRERGVIDDCGLADPEVRHADRDSDNIEAMMFLGQLVVIPRLSEAAAVTPLFTKTGSGAKRVLQPIVPLLSLLGSRHTHNFPLSHPSLSLAPTTAPASSSSSFSSSSSSQVQGITAYFMSSYVDPTAPTSAASRVSRLTQEEMASCMLWVLPSDQYSAAAVTTAAGAAAASAAADKSEVAKHNVTACGAVRLTLAVENDDDDDDDYNYVVEANAESTSSSSHNHHNAPSATSLVEVALAQTLVADIRHKVRASSGLQQISRTTKQHMRGDANATTTTTTVPSQHKELVSFLETESPIITSSSVPKPATSTSTSSSSSSAYLGDLSMPASTKARAASIMMALGKDIPLADRLAHVAPFEPTASLASLAEAQLEASKRVVAASARKEGLQATYRLQEAAGEENKVKTTVDSSDAEEYYGLAAAGLSPQDIKASSSSSPSLPAAATTSPSDAASSSTIDGAVPALAETAAHERLEVVAQSAQRAEALLKAQAKLDALALQRLAEQQAIKAKALAEAAARRAAAAQKPSKIANEHQGGGGGNNAMMETSSSSTADSDSDSGADHAAAADFDTLAEESLSNPAGPNNAHRKPFPGETADEFAERMQMHQERRERTQRDAKRVAEAAGAPPMQDMATVFFQTSTHIEAALGSGTYSQQILAAIVDPIIEMVPPVLAEVAMDIVLPPAVDTVKAVLSDSMIEYFIPKATHEILPMPIYNTLKRDLNLPSNSVKLGFEDGAEGKEAEKYNYAIDMTTKASVASRLVNMVTADPSREAIDIMHQSLGRNLFVHLNRTVTRRAARALSVALTQSLGNQLTRMTLNIFTHQFTVQPAQSLTRILSATLTNTVALTVTRALTRAPVADIFCELCRKGADDYDQGENAVLEFCDACYSAEVAGQHAEYITAYYANYYNHYYTWHYGGHYARHFAEGYFNKNRVGGRKAGGD